jgi:hypothetical protein
VTAASASTQRIVRQVNDEIFEAAALVSEDLLIGLFRSLFRVERATEFSEPEVFAVHDDPSLILDKRMSAAHWKYFAHFLGNEEILVKRFRQFTEFDFLFVADLTPSMGYRWRDVYLGIPGISENPDFIAPGDDAEPADYSSTKLYILKYLLYAFLFSAVRFGFNSRVLFFSLDKTFQLTGRGPDFPFQALTYVDDHFMDEQNPNRWDAIDTYPSPYEEVLNILLDLRSESVVVLATDFMDLVHGRIGMSSVDPFLAELKARHRLAVMQINDPHEVNTVENRDEHPTSTRWAFQRNVEVPSEGGIGKQRYYRSPGRNMDFMRHCREYLGRDDRMGGRISDMVASRGITLQKFVYGHAATGKNLIEERLQEISRWLEEN